jgi:hypothetical protein
VRDLVEQLAIQVSEIRSKTTTLFGDIEDEMKEALLWIIAAAGVGTIAFAALVGLLTFGIGAAVGTTCILAAATAMGVTSWAAGGVILAGGLIVSIVGIVAALIGGC